MAIDELQECRATIGRMDTALEDLRKFGFSLVTGLLTASALVGGLLNSRPVLTVTAAIVMVLVFALFGIDMYYQALLSGAVERAMDLEFDTHKSAVAITTTISRNATETHAVLAVLAEFALYVVLLLSSFVIGLLGTDVILPRTTMTAIGGLLLVSMFGYWMFVRSKTRLHATKARVRQSLKRGHTTIVTVKGIGFRSGLSVTTDIPDAKVDTPANVTSTSFQVPIAVPASAEPGAEYRLTVSNSPFGGRSEGTLTVT